jgi:DNA-binding transcriptional regulator YiaG
MPNIASVLKAEISRLAKKEMKAATTHLKTASIRYRSDIAKLKKLVAGQEKTIACLKKQVQQQPGQPQPVEDALDGVRYSARSVKAQRQRLGLSALDYGKLVGVSSLTIYNWEHGKARPREPQLAALVAVRNLGKRESLKKLAEVNASTAKKRRRGRAKR